MCPRSTAPPPKDKQQRIPGFIKPINRKQTYNSTGGLRVIQNLIFHVNVHTRYQVQQHQLCYYSSRVVSVV